ncbi:MAG TPA: hypothetical protein VNK43_12795 [Gemmatimonadales bacterium]|nr:hypothetical protein [Gemmatimonadales bacterium]
MKRLLFAFGALCLLGCAATPAVRAQRDGSGELPPAGFGTLNQDELAMVLRTEELEIRVLPLDERVLRLLARDAYASLSGVVRARRAAIDSVAGRFGLSTPGLVHVSFFARFRDARFDAQDLQLTIRNRLLRPVGIIPLSPGFGAQQLGLRQRASAIYVFEQEIPVYERFEVTYGVRATQDWGDKLSLIERERARVAGRARRSTPIPDDSAVPPDTTPAPDTAATDSIGAPR